MSDETGNWDSQIDNALLNAQAVLTHCPEPEDPDEYHSIVFGWLAIADAWIKRQENEAKFEEWRSGNHVVDGEEGALTFELDPEVVL